MSEMLANQYFLTRSYEKSIPLLRQVLEREPENTKCLKKLIICYTQVGDVISAKEIFLTVLRRDPYIIIDTDPAEDDCPCPGIVQQMEHQNAFAQNADVHFLILGMLYLYCDLKKSLMYFKKSLDILPDQPFITDTIKILKKRVKKSTYFFD